jgi:hypothetical protein
LIQVAKRFQRINQPFPITEQHFTTYLFLEAQLFIVSGAKTISKGSLQTKKVKNIKELLNLFISEYIQDNTDLANLRRLNLGYFRLLSDFLLFKLKSTDTFSLLVENDFIDDVFQSPEKSSSDHAKSFQFKPQDQSGPNSPQ